MNVEFTVDLDAFQGSKIGNDPNSKALNDGKESYFVGSSAKGSTQIGIDKDGKV